jgi:CheY-like chemotaxis protein
LVAEDDVLVRNLVRHLLEREGYHVIVAGDGVEALELSRQHSGTIDLLLTDVVMPRMNGLELVDVVRRERPELRVLVMSGHTSRELRAEKIQLPFLRKPFLAEAFRKKVRETLANPPTNPQEI